MVWGAFSANGKLQLRFTTSRMNGNEYQQVLRASLLPYLRAFRDLELVFQQDGAGVHTSNAMADWFESNNIALIDWPSVSPDLNPMENVWAEMVRRLYINNKQYESVDELKRAILEVWDSFPGELLKKLVLSMGDRIFQVINRNGKCTDY